MFDPLCNEDFTVRSASKLAMHYFSWLKFPFFVFPIIILFYDFINIVFNVDSFNRAPYFNGFSQ